MGRQTAEVTLEVDRALREVTAPADHALIKGKVLRAFEVWVFTQCKEWAGMVDEAKSRETRARRLATTADGLRLG